MYLALYRKYRPRTFDDVISQEHITTTLKNQVANDSTAHAYLFTGSRGTGKTTCAKILAMAVNCLDPQDGNPCLECERCREILDGAATDIVEMDAASNNGVDDVRQLRDEVAYTPVSCKYRVYIIDEVHMLSAAAFNALLKTLEEPPRHVKFILATTELHKVPATISSRCQRFEFRRVDVEDSAGRLLEVARKENVSLERAAAELISRLSDGGMRDALSILDRCISADSEITSEVVRSCAGVADRRHLFAFSEMIARRDTAGCIRLLGELHKGSKDIALVVDELSGQFRDLMLYKTAPDDKDLLTALPDEYEKLAEIAELYSLGDILRCLTLLQQCADGIGKVKQRKTLAEMCFVKMCTRYTGDTDERAAVQSAPPAPRKAAETAVRPVAASPEPKYESASEALAGVSSPELPEPPPISDSYAPPTDFYSDSYPVMSFEDEPEDSAPPPEPMRKRAVPDSITPEEWTAAVSRLDLARSTMLKDSAAEMIGGKLVIRTASETFLNNVKGEELERFENELSDVLGFTVRARLEKDGAENAPEMISALNKLLAKAEELGIEVKIKDQ